MIVVRYSIGWRGSVERGREVMAWSFSGLEMAGVVSLGVREAAALSACMFMLVVFVSDIRRVRLGKAGLGFGGGDVRRISRICEAV